MRQDLSLHCVGRCCNSAVLDTLGSIVLVSGTVVFLVLVLHMRSSRTRRCTPWSSHALLNSRY